jgi:hypothetical protein
LVAQLASWPKEHRKVVRRRLRAITFIVRRQRRAKLTDSGAHGPERVGEGQLRAFPHIIHHKSDTEHS